MRGKTTAAPEFMPVPEDERKESWLERLRGRIRRRRGAAAHTGTRKRRRQVDASRMDATKYDRPSPRDQPPGW